MIYIYIYIKKKYVHIYKYQIQNQIRIKNQMKYATNNNVIQEYQYLLYNKCRYLWNIYLCVLEFVANFYFKTIIPINLRRAITKKSIQPNKPLTH